MRNKDISLQWEIGELLQSDCAGYNLKIYFEKLPDNKIRRAISILINIYPNSTIVSDKELAFITYLISEKKFSKQENFFMFIASLNIIEFTNSQKNDLINVVMEHIETLCEVCTFELDTFLMRVFEPLHLFEYLKLLSIKENTAVLQHIASVLRDVNFFNAAVSDRELELFKQEVDQKLLR